MKDGIIRIGAVSPKIRVGDVRGNVKNIAEAAKRAAKLGVKLLLLPELCLTGATAGDLFLGNALPKAAMRGLDELCELTEELDMAIFVGLPLLSGARLYNAVAVISGGRVISATAKTLLSPDEARYFSPAPKEEDYESAVCVLSGVHYRANAIPALSTAVAVGSELVHPLSPARSAAVLGATLIMNPLCRPAVAGDEKKLLADCLCASREMHSAVAVATSGFGESGTDGVYSGKCFICSDGELLAEGKPFSEGEIVFAEIDCEALLSEKRRAGFLSLNAEPAEEHNIDIKAEKTELSRPPRRDPFVPETGAEEYLDGVTELQARALAGRLSRSHSKKAVLGVSGGLDSTHALLVAARAADILGLPRTSILSVTMPCFGTTVRTRGNAERLAEALGTDFRCVDIKASVTRHLKDIGHPEDVFDHVYENAQARERTQVLMDMANQCGGIVVGTGDLSELALGWATYNGDHMSMYGVNGGVPKSMMRRLVARIAERSEEAVRAVLLDVLATPVSPELLPPKDGEIAQVTEDLVGPYELHDFFLYYHARYGFTPEKILRLATAAFGGVYDPEVVRGWLKVFMHRFFAQQFKRSCLPDGPRVTEISLSPRAGFRMPSDMVADEWKL